ncbi:MAG TPA: MOSC domain-containing protein [Dyella sp.]|nr:MOSC domain-containing protein [Dyella sp.]
MQIKSVCVALPRDVDDGSRSVSTGIFKQPVEGPVRVLDEHLEGDGQADRIHHGGADKAVYAYALEHYPWWERELGRTGMLHGQFGENLTIAGLDEERLCVGDQLAIGSARFVVTQPRVPCFKLGLRFGDRSLPGRFAESLRTGMYLRVLDTGVLRAGERVERIACGRGGVAIRPLFAAWLRPNDTGSRAWLERALQVPELSRAWRESLEQRLARRHVTRTTPDSGDSA